MNKNNYLNECSTIEMSTPSCRYGKTFLLKATISAKSRMCSNFDFDKATDCYRVNLLENYRYGIEDMSAEEHFKLVGNQPILFLQEAKKTWSPLLKAKVSNDEALSDGSIFKWNGKLLYCINGKEDARKVALAHKADLHIVLAFDDPDADRYFILIDTGTDGGSKEDFLQWQQNLKDMILSRYFHNPSGRSLDFYIRALTSPHYDIIDRDALFGTPTNLEPASSVPTAPHLTTLDRIKSFLGHIFKTA